MMAPGQKRGQNAATESDAPRDHGAAACGAPEPPFNQTKLGVITIITALIVLIVFVGNMVYLFGSTFQQSQRNHRFTIAAVNYDSSDSIVWNSFFRADDLLCADSFASVVFLDTSTYPDPEQLVGAVREQEFWGAIYVNPGASSRLAAAVTAVAAYATPFNATEINVAPAPQASKNFYNTVIMAIGIVQQNVFFIAYTGISKASGLFTRPFKTSGTWALLVGVIYTFFGSLVTFALTWMVLWLGQHTYYQLLDGTLGLLPIQVFSFILVTFLFINITATIFPLESSPGFYRWGHALPAYQVLQVLLNVWPRGSHKLYEALPVLFSWWLVSATYAVFGTLKKSRDSRKNGATGGKDAPAVIPAAA
ncbi:hypothetical protein VTI74DRAFT_11197 [Chaetomium olivicolor]